MSASFVLYSSEGCHLCEQALEICLQLVSKDKIRIVDIVEDDSLVEKYGVHIPVLERLSDNKELFWPFDAHQLAEFI